MASEDDYPALPPDLGGPKKRKRSQENDLRRLEELAKGVIRFKPFIVGGDGVGAAEVIGTQHAPDFYKVPGKWKKSQDDQQIPADDGQPQGFKRAGQAPAAPSHVDQADSDPASLKKSRKEKRRDREQYPQGEPMEDPAAFKKSRKEKGQNRDQTTRGEPTEEPVYLKKSRREKRRYREQNPRGEPTEAKGPFAKLVDTNPAGNPARLPANSNQEAGLAPTLWETRGEAGKERGLHVGGESSLPQTTKRRKEHKLEDLSLRCEKTSLKKAGSQAERGTEGGPPAGVGEEGASGPGLAGREERAETEAGATGAESVGQRKRKKKRMEQGLETPGGDAGVESDGQRKRKKKGSQQEGGNPGGMTVERNGEYHKAEPQAEGAPASQGKKRMEDNHRNAGDDGDINQVEALGRQPAESAPQGKKKKHAERQAEVLGRQVADSAPQGKEEKQAERQGEALGRQVADSAPQGKKKKHAKRPEVPRGGDHCQGPPGEQDMVSGEGEGAATPRRGKKESVPPASAHLLGLSTEHPAAAPQRKSKNKFLVQAGRDGSRFSTSKRAARLGGKARDDTLPFAASDASVAKGKEKLDAASASVAKRKEKTVAAAASIATAKEKLDAANASVAKGKKKLDAADASVAKGKEKLNTADAAVPTRKEKSDAANPSVAKGKKKLDAADAAVVKGQEKVDATGATGKKNPEKLSSATGTEPGGVSASGAAVSHPIDKPPEKVLARRANAVLQHLMQGGTVPHPMQGGTVTPLDPPPGLATPATPAGPGTDDGGFNAAGSQPLHTVGKGRRAEHVQQATQPDPPPEPRGRGAGEWGAVRSREASEESPNFPRGAAEGPRDARHSGLMGAGSARKPPRAGSDIGGQLTRVSDQQGEGVGVARGHPGKEGVGSVPKGASKASGGRGEKSAKDERGLMSGRVQAVGEKSGKSQGGSLLGRMQQQLQGGFFRYLNEQMYTTDGESSLQMMQAQPQLYEEYHKGFRKQTEGWPLQPVDVAIQWLKGQDPGLRVADFGCGDARLAASVPQAVQSLDLVAGAPGVIACNMAHTPLGTASVDVAVFCLALMGTDYPSFLKEAARVLRPGGTLWIAEVRSRFAGREGTEDPGPFLAALRTLGFVPVQRDMSNTMFVTFILEKRGKAGPKSQLTAWPALKPCIYKRR